MTTSDIRHVKKARKNHICDWCYTLIEIGRPYKSWFCYEDAVTVKIHPECYVASQNVLTADDPYLPMPGTYRRGCWCGENKENCTCDIQRQSQVFNEKLKLAASRISSGLSLIGSKWRKAESEVIASQTICACANNLTEHGDPISWQGKNLFMDRGIPLARVNFLMTGV